VMSSPQAATKTAATIATGNRARWLPRMLDMWWTPFLATNVKLTMRCWILRLELAAVWPGTTGWVGL